jgi:hypothetical protein
MSTTDLLLITVIVLVSCVATLFAAVVIGANAHSNVLTYLRELEARIDARIDALGGKRDG